MIVSSSFLQIVVVSKPFFFRYKTTLTCIKTRETQTIISECGEFRLGSYTYTNISGVDQTVADASQ